MLSEKEISQIKTQIIQQIDSTFPEDKKESAKQQILSMDEPQLEEFLKQNKLLRTSSQTQGGEGQNQESIFRAIVDGKVPSHKIDENNDCIAILELNPVSKGHVIIIPKEAASSSDKIPKSVFTLANQIAKKLKTKLKAKDTSISSSNLFGESIINVLPIYKDETINSQRYKAEEKELEGLQEKLKKKEVKKVIKKPKTKTLKSIRLPKRIP